MFTAIRAFLMGLLIGLLVTPHSGEQNRRRLMDWLMRVGSSMSDTLKEQFEAVRPEIKARLSQIGDQAKSTAKTAEQRAGVQLSQARSQLPDKIRGISANMPERAVVIGGVIREEIAGRVGRRQSSTGSPPQDQPENPEEIQSAAEERTGNGGEQESPRGRTRSHPRGESSS